MTESQNITTNLILPKITDLTQQELSDWAISVGQKPFRAIQLFQWLYLHKVDSWEKMTNLSIKFRAILEKSFNINRIKIIDRKTAPDGTVKILQELEDGYTIESVLLIHDDHYTVCISTQVGCAMACKFCLTAGMGLKRNLSAGEIVEQVLNLYSLLPEGQAIRNIVYMGMGEPFHNYDNTIKSLNIFQNNNGFNFSSRRITVSTSGIIPGIKKFALEKDKANLAVSLNGVTQEARQKLMPVSKRYSLEELIQACKEFPSEARKRITFEYILMKGITDSQQSARKLVSLLHGVKSKVNLIAYNENPALDFKSPDRQTVKLFQQYLLDHGIIATLRSSKGQGISAACGQLATQHKTNH
ncbi:23S rRNA (adenine(2503)-C(2))-methyltransferase RlmN [bacterium]|nr:23S rRNA (adenine(2503)-C(2))-methyltransferase RlmN [bacterium]